MDGECGTELDAEGEAAPDADVALLGDELARLVRAHGGSEVVLFTAAEMERREFAACAHGWNDALASLPLQSRRPRFVEKSARSKSPTVPKLERGSSRRPDRRDFFDH
ncbi:hypothetical protein ACFU53_38090 [Streptomyces sp. NPDC057474]|uniref:hypothetical protein n=1 Tax=Streptomyces sp. NPDC057474 TaxID=3346144 RepID=UPI00367A78AB